MNDPYKLANSIRFSEDTISLINSKDVDYSQSDLEFFHAQNSIQITNKITPELFSALEKTSNNLNLKSTEISSFVYNSPEINARCFLGEDEKFVVLISSSLVKLLTTEELVFVIGHELGHLLLNHTKEEKNNSPQGLIKSRAKEISVDRIGLMASRNIDISIKAMIKTIAGLDEKYIKFNTSELLKQLSSVKKNTNSALDQSTHPSFLLRIKALVWFSLSNEYLSLANKSGKDLDQIDVMIQKDLDTYINNSVKSNIEKSKKSFQFWLMIFAAAEDGKFTKNEQREIVNSFGQEKLEKFLYMIEGMDLNGVNKIVKNKLIDAYRKMSSQLAGDAVAEAQLNIQKVGERLKVANLESLVLNLIN